MLISSEYQRPIHQHYTAGTHMSRSLSSQSPSSAGSTPGSTPSANSASNTSVSSSTDGTSKAKSKAVKTPNVFSNDGSFLDRMRRSIKEEDDKKKEKEALERKKHFADRFKTRGKRPLPTNSESLTSTSHSTTPESDESPRKKLRLKEDDKEAGSAQAEYHKALESYSGSLKDGGNGVRPLIK